MRCDSDVQIGPHHDNDYELYVYDLVKNCLPGQIACITRATLGSLELSTVTIRPSHLYILQCMN